MKNTIITIALTLLSISVFAQKDSQLTAYPDQDGNWIVIVDKDQNSAADLRIFDRDGRLLAVRRISKNAEISKIKIQTEQTADSVFKVDLRIKGESVLERELSKAAQLPAEHWMASAINE